MPLPLIVSCFSKIQIGFTFLVPAHPGSPGQRAVKWVCKLWYPDVRIFAVTGKLFLIFFRLELGGPRTRGPSGLCPPCPPHCYATDNEAIVDSRLRPRCCSLVSYLKHTSFSRRLCLAVTCEHYVIDKQRTKVCRYNWHSAGSLGRPFPMLKY